MQLPLAYLDPSAIEEVPMDLWREVFDALGWPQSLAGRRDECTHDDVRDAIRRDDLSDGLLHALEALHTLGTEKGRESIVSVMSERQVQMNTLGHEASARELAMRLFLGQRGDASLADVFARAQIQAQEAGEHRRYNEFLGKEAKAVTDLRRRRQALAAAVLRHCQESDLGEHVQVEGFEDDGVHVFSVLRSDRMRKPLAVVPGQDARTLIPFRPVYGDILRYEVALGRLRVAAHASSMVDFYRSTLGRILFDDEDFFTGDAVCNLRVLQERGRAALDDHNVFSISRVRLTECLWERGDRNLIHIRARDCFDSIDELRLPLAEGTLVQAKLKVDVIGRSARPVTVTIRVPSRIEVTQKIAEPLIDRLLDAIGIRTAAALPKLDLWALNPWRHPLPVWRSLFGATTDSLVQQGVLGRVQLHAVPHPGHPDAGRVLRVHPIADGEFHGISDNADIPSRALSATDVEGLEFRPEQFRQYLRTILGIVDAGVVWSAGDEVLELGSLAVAGHRLYVAYALRHLSPGIGSRLTARASGAPAVLLIPPTRTAPPDLATVRLSTSIPSQRQVIAEGSVACGFADGLPAIHRAPNGAELVVDTQLKKVWVHGLELQHLKADSQAFQFIEMLARSNGAPVSSDAITRALSSGRLDTDGTTAARQAKRNAKKIIVEAMNTAGVSSSGDPFPSAGIGHYRCVLRSFVI